MSQLILREKDLAALQATLRRFDFVRLREKIAREGVIVFPLPGEP